MRGELEVLLRKPVRSLSFLTFHSRRVLNSEKKNDTLMVVHDQYGYTNLSNSTSSDICYFPLIFLPMHRSPSDLKPGKHTQYDDPIVLMQVA